MRVKESMKSIIGFKIKNIYIYIFITFIGQDDRQSNLVPDKKFKKK